jgi:hypothetical protein
MHAAIFDCVGLHDVSADPGSRFHRLHSFLVCLSFRAHQALLKEACTSSLTAATQSSVYFLD